MRWLEVSMHLVLFLAESATRPVILLNNRASFYQVVSVKDSSFVSLSLKCVRSGLLNTCARKATRFFVNTSVGFVRLRFPSNDPTLKWKTRTIISKFGTKALSKRTRKSTQVLDLAFNLRLVWPPPTCVDFNNDDFHRLALTLVELKFGRK